MSERKVGFACGVFDLFHAGHVIMLEDCKKHCDYLVVGINTADDIDPAINPGKKKPVYSFEERKLIMGSIQYVDEVVGYSSEEELIELMSSGRFHVRFLGDDYEGKPITGPGLIEEIVYLDRSHGYSTSSIRNRILGSK